MPVRPLNLDTISPTTAAMFDRLVTGEPIPTAEVLQIGREACIAHEADVARAEGLRVLSKAKKPRTAPLTDEQILTSGAKSKAYNNLMIAVRRERVERLDDCHRMTPDTVAQWLALRPNLTATTPTPPPATVTATRSPLAVPAPRTAPVLPADLKYTSDRHFGGIQEDEGWYYAPQSLHTLVHFRSLDDFDLDAFRADLPTGMTVEYDDMTDLYRVYGRAGQDDGENIEVFIDAWCESQNVTVKGRRTEKKATPRRDLSMLPPRFWDELCRYYGDYAMRVAQRHMSSIRMHVPDNDDVQQYVYLWVIRAAIIFDHTRGVPFGAWLTQKVPAWAQDLARSRFGRTAYDVELNLKRTINAFTAENNRRPTDHEIAEIMGVSIDVIRKNSTTVATIDNLRTAQTIETGPDAPEIPIVDAHDVTEEIMSETDQSLISHALTASCAADPKAKGRAAQPNVLGWAAWYFTTWGGMTKQSLANELGTSHRNINVYTDKTKEKMQERLADLMSD